jgi:phospholipid/cholesterol/gamma-HCH transport system substrate-binding protein
MAEREEGSATPIPTVPPRHGQGKTAWVGVFLIIGIVAVLIVLFVMTDAAIFRGRYIVTTHVPDAGGIRKGDPVRLRGVNVGRIMGFDIQPLQQGVSVRLEIEGEYKIPKDSVVELSSAGPLGGMKADVHPGQSSELARYGDSLAGKTTVGLLDRSDELAQQAQEVMKRIEVTLSTDAVDDLHGSVAELRTVLKQLSATVTEQRTELRDVSTNLKKSTDSVAKATGGPELDRIVKRVDTLSARLDTVSESLGKSSNSLESLMGRIERGEGSLGKLTRDAALYDNLNRAALNFSQASENINKLTEEIRRDPKRYLKLSVF